MNLVSLLNPQMQLEVLIFLIHLLRDRITNSNFQYDYVPGHRPIVIHEVTAYHGTKMLSCPHQLINEKSSFRNNPFIHTNIWSLEETDTIFWWKAFLFEYRIFHLWST